MELRWVRLCIFVGVLLVIVAGVSALASPGLEDKVTSSSRIPCGNLRHDVCTIACEDSVYTHGLCYEHVIHGPKTARFITVECCCCTMGWRSRAFSE